jgi:formamidopyrimidine-DNA glycosylase
MVPDKISILSTHSYMPELPEVETVVRGLQQMVLYKQITAVEVFHIKPLVNSQPRQFKEFLHNEVIAAIRRLGKYLIFTFQSRKQLVVHLRMTGKFIFLPPAPINSASAHPADASAPAMASARQTGARAAQPYSASDPKRAHIRLLLRFQDRSTLLFQDVRVFGTFKIYAAGQPLDEERRIGPDPFSSRLTQAWLATSLRKRQQALKVVLLDQKLISGLGNIYVCEALHAARLSPFLPAQRLNLEQARVLIQCIRRVLKRALKYGGTTINDFSHIDEKSGQFQQMLKVYQREGELCNQCGRGRIRRQKQAQRSTYFCPVCQG